MQFAISLLLLCCSLSTVASQNTAPTSCQAEVFVPDSLKRTPSILSPDGQFRVILGDYQERKDSEEGMLRVFKGEMLLGRYMLQDLSAGIFVKWSPDSRAFYVMWSHGGMIGGYDVRVFRVLPNNVREIFPTKLAVREFKRKHNCRARGINVFAIKWIDSSKRFEIATQVYPTGDCGKDMGFTSGYAVRVDDGAIVERYSQDAIEREMKECPTIVWPTGLWDDDTLQQAKPKIASHP